jgi:hypothetical protein
MLIIKLIDALRIYFCMNINSIRMDDPDMKIIETGRRQYQLWHEDQAITDNHLEWRMIQKQTGRKSAGSKVMHHSVRAITGSAPFNRHGALLSSAG